MGKPSGGVLYYFTLCMTAVYALLGIYIMISGRLEFLLPGKKKYIIGTLLIFYSFYRAYRIYRINKNMQDDSPEQ
jgi:hypothetical protein